MNILVLNILIIYVEVLGKHYIPKFYLKGFIKNKEQRIWAYRKDGSCFEVSLDKIAQETNMYSDDKEKFFTEEIENPANQVISKIRKKKQLDLDDKKVLTKYMICLLQRTPESYENYLDNSEESLSDILNEEQAKLSKLMVEDSKNKSRYENILSNLEEVISKFKISPPRKAWEMSINPDLFPLVSYSLLNKKWSFLYADSYRSAFITSDAPIFYFRNLGLRHIKSEVTFPISKDVCLHAKWSSNFDNDFIKISEKAIKEINYRTASNIYRYGFFSEEKKWVKKIITKKDYGFNFLK